MNSETKICQNCKKDFIIEPEDFSFYEKIKVPPPTFCFQCRLQRKLAYINERSLYKRLCDKCKTPIISIFSSKNPFVVYCSSCYHSDDKDELEHGFTYDFSCSFFVQFYDLAKKVPRLHLVHKNNNSEGCEYANYTYKSRNVYLSSNVVSSEDIYYCKQVLKNNKTCLDSSNILENERGYELVDSSGNYNCRFLIRSSQCVDSVFLLNSRNCVNCCLSTNQINKSYVFRNQQLTREEYLKAVADLKLDTYSGQYKSQEEFFNITKSTICRFSMMKNCTNCTGNSMENCNNVKYSFDIVNSENAKHVVVGVNKMIDSRDLYSTGKLEMCYEMANGGAVSYKVLFGLDIGVSQNVFYSISCNNCHDIFGCIGLYGKQYYILNKQYTKEEYEILLPKIIKHMNDMPYINKRNIIYKFGEYFPTEFSFFAYNESLAYEEFPISLSKVEENGYIWAVPEEKHHIATIQSDLLPDSISEIKDSIVKEIIACPNNGKVQTQCMSAFRIVPEELRLYRLMNIPIPRFCPNCRFYERRKWKLPWKLWHRACMKEGCTNEFETSYSPDRPEIIYCERCYQQEVI